MQTLVVCVISVRGSPAIFNVCATSKSMGWRKDQSCLKTFLSGYLSPSGCISSGSCISTGCCGDKIQMGSDTKTTRSSTIEIMQLKKPRRIKGAHKFFPLFSSTVALLPPSVSLLGTLIAYLTSFPASLDKHLKTLMGQLVAFCCLCPQSTAQLSPSYPQAFSLLDTTNYSWRAAYAPFSISQVLTLPFKTLQTHTWVYNSTYSSCIPPTPSLPVDEVLCTHCCGEASRGGSFSTHSSRLVELLEAK